MKSVYCILALLALISMVASSRIRMSLDEAPNNRENDEFFLVKNRKVYTHDLQPDTVETSNTNLFVANVRVGSELVDAQNG